MNSQGVYQFWIDVGGTFTDCFAKSPDGSLRRHKVLSSGVTKGAIDSWRPPDEGDDSSVRSVLLDAARRGDPPDFWTGYQILFLDSEGEADVQAKVVAFDSQTGELRLDRELPPRIESGFNYELSGGEESPVLAIRYLLGLRLRDRIPKVTVRLGTTRGTNALITRRGARAALVTTHGFGDVLKIGYQNRPDLFALSIRKPARLAETVLEVDERIAADGTVLQRLRKGQVREQLQALHETGIRSLAICLLNSYGNRQHEEQIAKLAEEVGFEEISVSSRICPLIKIVSRGDTTVVDAYLNPVLRQYVESLRQALGESELRLLTSAGGLVHAEAFVGKDSILSGPAGGVVGYSRVAQAAGFEKSIGFDMGGTSTDVSRFDGRYRMEYETEKAGVRIVAPMMSIETVAAGGGSLCHFDGVKLAVGPQSAGSDPGPACYGRGGPLAVTDINFYLGKILKDRFPFPLDRSAVEKKLKQLCQEIEAATGTDYTPHELATGFLKVANANMAKAIHSVSIAQGADHREYLLVAFGGAAPQHACAVARQLGIRQVLNHPDSGILSAYGIGLADVTRFRVQGVYQTYDAAAREQIEGIFQTLTQEAVEEVVAEGIPRQQVEVVRMLELRYVGVDASFTIPEPVDRDYRAGFEREHEKLYGYVQHERDLEIVAVHIEAIGRSSGELPASAPAPLRTCSTNRTANVFFDSQEYETPVFDRSLLVPGDVISGPAIVLEDVSTTVIDPGWKAEVLTQGELLLTDVLHDGHDNSKNGQSDESTRPTVRLESVSSDADPVMLEIFNNQFAGIAERMGITLRNTSSSVNVKERLDFSCAIFTASGDLVVNAPHIPVHLGAMSETIRCVLQDNPGLAPGDVIVTNDPFRGGSHLPDVTVITPVFDEQGERLFFTASRAHHAEIGGIRPGSMPPFSKTLAEEGVLIRNFKLVDRGQSREEELRRLLAEAQYPSRNVADNLADVAAQVAANHQGVTELLALIAHYSKPVVLAYMNHIQNAASKKIRAALASLPDGRREFVDHLDDGSPIAVAIEIAGDRATFDFTGTGAVLTTNLNANRAIVSSAILYCLRLLIDEDIPLNQGVLEPVEIVLPECLLNPPAGETAEQCAAVAGGNVETSQRVVDTILGALQIAAASQGTMNNLLFGDDTFGYYETIGGGAGATNEQAGADAVHTHMTNTRLTDPEVLESRYPVRVEQFAIRSGSGGSGRHAGGCGIVRELRFLRDLEVSLITGRRGAYAPYGCCGGKPGRAGRNVWTHADGREEELPAAAQFRAEKGDLLRIETPGGGGYGSPDT